MCCGDFRKKLHKIKSSDNQFWIQVTLAVTDTAMSCWSGRCAEREILEGRGEQQQEALQGRENIYLYILQMG